MNNFWNERYNSDEYVYGTHPNQYFKEQIDKLKPGKILFPAEGEGRNAVYAATKGWQVFAFDASSEGKKKADQLAKRQKVEIDYQVTGYENIDFPKESFDCIVFIFAHIHSSKRNEYHCKLVSYLKPGGILIMESFSKKQILNRTGGPKDLDMLYSKEELQNDFTELTTLEISENDTALNEGSFHQGVASVIRILGVK